MATVTAFSDRDIGKRDRLEDFSIHQEVETAGGLKLMVILVADGAGGGDAGEQAARLTGRTILAHMQVSLEQVVPKLLIAAVEEANRAVYDELHGAGTSTVAMAVVDLQDQTAPHGRLYIAHIGDSYICLMRDNQLVRLNIDHTLANEYFYAGQISEAEAQRLQNANYPSRMIGVNPEIQVDIGFYAEKERNFVNAQRAFNIGKRGLSLDEGDTVFVASDGMFRINPEDGKPYIYPEELLRHALDDDVERATNSLQRYASNRHPDDNSSIAMLFVPSRARRAVRLTARLTPRQRAFSFALLVVALIGAGVLFFLMASTESTRLQVVSTQQAVEDARATIQQIALQLSWTPTNTPEPSPTPTATPTSTPTPRPTAVGENQVGVQYFGRNSSAEPIPLLEGRRYASANPSFMVIDGINPPPEGNPASIFLMNNTQLDVRQARNENGIRSHQYNLYPSGDIFVNNQDFMVGGLRLSPLQNTNLAFDARSLCVTAKQIDPDPNNPQDFEKFAFTCISGVCTLQIPGQEPLNLDEGMRMLFRVDDGSLISQGPTIYDEMKLYYDTVVNLIGDPSLAQCLSESLDPDGDSVPYPQDLCEFEFGSVAASGCPDEDEDGIPDVDDLCPTEAGTAEFQGCPPPTPTPLPDLDGDGLEGDDDLCPFEPGPVENDGCPLPTDEAAAVNLTATMTATITRTPTATPTEVNLPPAASFSANCTALTCAFNATASSDSDGSIVSYAWNFGDGASGNGIQTSRTYANPGAYTVTLTVTDNRGATDTATRTVNLQAPNVPPIADFSVSCTNLTCNFNASSSSDPDGFISSYTWDYGDGNTGSGVNVSRTYAAPGPRSVALTVTDNRGATNTTVRTINPTNPNVSPNASFTVSCTNLTCNFNASASSDPDGTITSYAWTFGDGSSGTGVNTSRTYATAGERTVTLTVTDNQGASNSTTRTAVTTLPNVAPTASFTVSCTGLTCTFNSSASSDSDGTIVSYAWNFGDGGTSSATSPSRTYAAAGSYTVTLVVTDDDGATGTTTRTANPVNPNQPPVASFTVSCTNLTCTFNSSGSSDPDGTIASYAWNFGDGGTSTNANPSRTYATAGSYTVQLTVTDNQGATNSTTRTANPTNPNQPPVASFTVSCTNLTCNFNASASSDPDGSITGYTWNFGDGNTGSGQTTSRTYATAGSYTVQLTVTDNQGATNSTTRTANPTNPNQPPNASFTVSCTGLTCGFNASASTDPDGTITSYAWNFGDSNTGTGVTAIHTYASPGNRTVTLTVTDNQGATDTDTESANPTGSDPNLPPTASFTVSCTNLTCNVNASGSTDPDGTIASYTWNFGDGSNGLGQTTSHTYATAGSFTITLTVADNVGETDTDTANVNVNTPPTASFTVSCSGYDCTFDASGSADVDGTIASYSWDFGDTNSDTGETTSHTYAAAGSYTVTLTVTDNLGATATTTRTAVANNAPTASFTVSCTNLTCNVDATASSDSDGTIASYGWNFGDTTSGSGVTTSRTYATSGNYTITLTVTDNLGGTATSSQTVTANTLPTASFTVSCTVYDCTFDASGSSDSDGTIASYAWNFGDGNNGTGVNPSHTYAAGSYTVTLTVTDNLGGTATTSSVVVANAAPNASFTMSCSSYTCTFDASGSSDSDGTIASYSWNFGDGNTGSGVNPTHIYGGPGSYTVTLTVTDNLGGTGTSNGTAVANNSPSASFTVNCTVYVCDFDATASSDGDGTISSYSWTFGDGNNGSGVTVNHDYGGAGTFTVTLTVTDNLGGTASSNSNVTVNVAPTASFTSSCTLLECTFTSTSTDSDGSIASATWDFGDGNNGSGNSVTHTYAAAGNYTVSLTVTDNLGAAASTNTLVAVSASGLRDTLVVSGETGAANNLMLMPLAIFGMLGIVFTRRRRADSVTDEMRD